MTEESVIQDAQLFLAGTMENFSWVWWPQTHAILWAPGLREIFRVSEREAAFTHDSEFFSRVHEDDLPGFMVRLQQVLDGHCKSNEDIIRVRRGDNSWAWVLSRYFIVREKSGETFKITGYLIDLSHLRLHSRFFLAMERQNLAGYHAMLENSPDLVSRLNKNLSFIYVNPTLNRYMTSRVDSPDHEEAFAAPLGEEHLAFVRANAAEVFAGGAVRSAPYAFASELRGDVSGEYTFWPELDPDGTVHSVIAQFRDNTEHLRLEQQARLNARRLAALYELGQMADRPEEEIMGLLTEYITELTGGGCGYIFFIQDAEEETGRVFWSKAHYDFLDPADMPATYLPEGCLGTGRDQSGRFHARFIVNGDGEHPMHTVFDGKYKVMRHMHVTVFDGEKPVCIAAVSNKPTPYEESDLIQLSLFIDSAVNIMNRHEYFRYLKEAKETAERLNRAKDEFLANISHELRTPLNGILSMLQLLELSSLPPEQLEHARAATSSGKALLRIIGDILDLSVMESGKMTMHTVPYSLRDVLHSTINLFAGELAQKGLRLDLEIAPDVPELMRGDDARMRQIVFNVMGNAIKFTEKGAVSIYCGLVGSRPDRRRVYLAIADTGIGIPDDQHSLIFDAFTQVDSSSSRKYAGTGLGLNIVRRLMAAMGGSLTLESELGRGTTVHLSLPVTPVARENAGKERALPAASPHRSLDVLVAEDDAVSRRALKLLLQRSGHRVLCVSDGRQALESLLLHDFHCVFTDVQMPGMDGLELVRRIRANQMEDITPSGAVLDMVRELWPEAAPAPKERANRVRDAIITAVSAHAMAGDKERFLSEGMDFYISKPVDLRELDAVLACIVRKLAEAESVPA
ncbi:putative Histidine kinase [uncultured delta proteobacterium]|uniref:histidine kinase n=1 Tax=uncultured delta proteobacterium TaxID=34034 RepID=A0A212K6U6_9DELT|nr:putative Histidine kinase [uncultured delta proteobacterium]